MRKARSIKQIAIIGSGLLGTQIAIQAAYHGYPVSIFDSDPEAFHRSVQNIRFRIKVSGKTPRPPFEDMDQSLRSIRIHQKIEETVENADLIMEAVFEDLNLKRELFQMLDGIAPPGAILATNSSSIPVSRIAPATRRAERCLNIHFYKLDLKRGVADIMGGPGTLPDILECGRNWVRSIGCIPLMVNKEALGFCFNRIWRAVKREALHSWAQGIADFRDIDRGWMSMMEMDQGPFGLMDGVGLDVVYDIEMIYYRESGDARDRPPEKLKEMIERNELGIKTGKGFYSYPESGIFHARFSGEFRYRKAFIAEYNDRTLGR